MIRHIIRLMWNQKKRNALIIIEMLIVFMVMFFAVYFLSADLSRLMIPMAVNSENVGTIGFYTTDTNPENVRKSFIALKAHLQQLKFVEKVSYSRYSVPFEDSYSGSDYFYGNKQIQFSLHEADGDYQDLLQIPLLKGRWPLEKESENSPLPAVITEDAAKTLFGNQNPIGKILSQSNKKKSGKTFVITGIIPIFKQFDYAEIDAGFFTTFNPLTSTDESIRIMIKIRDGQKAVFFNSIEKEIFSVVDRDKWFIWSISTLEDNRINANAAKRTGFYTRAIISSIVIINILLGFIGVMWYNINLRRKEIGLRMAVGSPAIAIRWQLITESLVLAMFGMIPALVLILQVFLLKVFDFESGVFLFSLIFSILTLLLLIVISAWYPGMLASKIKPAIALHSE